MAEPYFCEANPSAFFPHVQRAGDMMKMSGDGADVFLYFSLFNWCIPCMYCGADSDKGLSDYTLSGSMYKIVFCVDKCMARAREDHEKVTALFAQWSVQAKAQAQQAKAQEQQAQAQEQQAQAQEQQAQEQQAQEQQAQEQQAQAQQAQQ